MGRTYKTASGKKFFHPVIKMADKKSRLLSFINLVEIHVLDAIRREHNVAFPKVRGALSYVERKFPVAHPLADHKFKTDGADLFIEKFGKLINISEDGQMAIREILNAHLKRVKRDAQGVPIKLYPYTRKKEMSEPEVVVIDPLVSFGRPVLSGTGIATSIIAERYKAGESINGLADDYGCEPIKVEEAIRCELSVEAA